MPITLLTFKEAATQYHLSLEQLQEMVKSGRISAVAMNGHSLVDEDEVRKVTGQNGSDLHWISMQEAVEQFSLSEELLERLAKDGVIRSGILEGKLHLVFEDIQPIAARLNRANFHGLEGHAIELGDASTRYQLSRRSLLNWAKRGHIRVLRAGRRPLLLNEADVAYTKELANIRGITEGKALFPTSQQYSPPWVSK